MNNSGFLLLTSYVVNAAWQVAILAFAAWGLSRLVKRAGPELQHKIWVATLILATLAPATPVIQSLFVRRALTGQANVDLPGAAPVAAHYIPLTGSDIIFQPAVLYVVSGLYLAAVLFGFLRLCWMVYRTAGLVRNASPVSMGSDHAALWHTSKASLSVPSAAMLQSRDVSGPVTAGLWRPVLLLPQTFMEDHSPTELSAAIAHECAHMKRDDLRKNLFYEIVGLFTVFHPATWFIRSQIAQTREMICDRMAAEQLQDRRAYAVSLLQLARKMLAVKSQVSHALGMFDAKILEKRIMVLTSAIPRLSRIQRSFWTVTAILILSICAAGIGSMTRIVAAAPSPADKKKTPNLDCTYYDKHIVGLVGHAGTCGYDRNDKKKYACYLNSDTAQSEPQSGCEWKVRRAEAAKQ
jgi:beta-lactamase regulating signal transducer with metallopeptidase domain